MFDERYMSILEAMKIPNVYWKNQSREYQYWFRSLLQKIDSALVFKGLPADWPQDFFLFCLWSLGYVAVFKSERFGDKETKVAFFPATVSQYDFYYQPVKALVCNPLFEKQFTIHKDCEILKLTPDCYWKGGCLDIIDWYASRLAELTKGIDMGLINAKVPLMGIPKNQAAAQQLRAIYDKVQAGEPLVLFDDKTDKFDEVMPSKEPFFTWTNNFRETYIVPELLENLQTIMDQFYMEIGLPVPDTQDKRAHLLQSEVDFTEVQSQARIKTWVTTLTESFEYINKMFGLNLEVDYAQRTENESLGSRAVPESDE